MIPTIKLTPKRAIVSATGSKGCQPKWFENNIWYKADSVGYESFAEVVASRVAHILNINMPIVDYSLCYVSLPAETKRGCFCKSFLSGDAIEVTAQHKLESIYGKSIVDKLTPEDTITAIIGFNMHLRDQLSCLFQFDRLLKNGDRHLSNIAIRMNNDSEDIILFDNGDSCTADITYEFTQDMSLSECLAHQTSKPFLWSFDKNCELIKNYSSFELKALSDTLLISDLQEYVPAWFYTRVSQILTHQFKVYLKTNLNLI